MQPEKKRWCLIWSLQPFRVIGTELATALRKDPSGSERPCRILPLLATFIWETRSRSSNLTLMHIRQTFLPASRPTRASECRVQPSPRWDLKEEPDSIKWVALLGANQCECIHCKSTETLNHGWQDQTGLRFVFFFFFVRNEWSDSRLEDFCHFTGGTGPAGGHECRFPVGVWNVFGEDGSAPSAAITAPSARETAAEWNPHAQRHTHTFTPRKKKKNWN